MDELQPVELLISGDHAYKNRGANKNGCGVKMPNGKLCMKAAYHRCHLTHPLSLNVLGSRGDYRTYKRFKAAWEELICEALEASGLPAGWREGATPETPKIQLINVEATLCFSITRGRDAGNFRWFLEKICGDALVDGYGYATGAKSKGTYQWHQVNPGGWLEDDTIHPIRRFDFGGLEIVVRPDEAWTRLDLFPS